MKTLFSALCFIIILMMITEQNIFAQDWTLSGNNLTGTEKLGTLNNTDLRIITNNQRRITIKANGRVGIGVTSPAYRLDVNGSLNIAFDSSIRSGGAKILTNLYSSENTFIGYGAGYSTNPIDNLSGSRNTFTGWNAGDSNVNGSFNSYYGDAAGLFTTGNENTFIGASAGEYTYGGSYNTFVGRGAGLLTAAGSYNCFFGDSSGWGGSGNENVYIGYLATSPHSSALTNSAAIGCRASVTASNSMMFGNSNVNSWGFGISSPVAGQALKVGSSSSNGNGAYLTNGGVWTDVSDPKKKENIVQLDKAEILNKINKLEVTKWKYTGTKDEYHIGPMADDFYKLFSVGNDSAISNMDKTGVLFLGVKALIEKNESIQSALKAQQDLIQKQQLEIEELKQMLQTNSKSNASSAFSIEPGAGSDKVATFILDQNSPNPSSSITTVNYGIPPNSKNAQLAIRNSLGETIKLLTLHTGKGMATIDVSGLSNDVYNYSLVVDGKLIETKMMMVMH